MSEKISFHPNFEEWYPVFVIIEGRGKYEATREQLDRWATAYADFGAAQDEIEQIIEESGLRP